jgi:type IV pilus assembly protein PilM
MKMAIVQHKQGFKGRLLALEQESIPEGVIVDNEIKNSIVLSEKVQSLLLKTSPSNLDGDFIASVNWTSGILCDRILVKYVPKVPENELILQAAMARSPFDEPNNVLDYFVVDRRDDGVEAIIVAAKKDVVSTWVDLFKTLNIKLAAIDIDAFALSNAYFLSSSQGPSDEQHEEDDSVLLLNLGYNKSYLAFMRNGHFNTARSFIGCSIQEMLEQLSSSLKIMQDKARDLLFGNSGKELESDESGAKAAMEAVLEDIGVKVDNAIRYFSSSDNYKTASRIIIAGGAGINGLATHLSDRFSLDVFPLNPFRSVQIDPVRFRRIDFNAVASVYSVALGLALRKF